MSTFCYVENINNDRLFIKILSTKSDLNLCLNGNIPLHPGSTGTVSMRIAPTLVQRSCDILSFCGGFQIIQANTNFCHSVSFRSWKTIALLCARWQRTSLLCALRWLVWRSRTASCAVSSLWTRIWAIRCWMTLTLMSWPKLRLQTE